MKNAVAKTTISIGVDASQWSYYSGGIYDGYCGTQPDHGVTCVGYGGSGTGMYWIVKNSWNTWWGENGYIKLKRTDSTTNVGQCAVAGYASYVEV